MKDKRPALGKGLSALFPVQAVPGPERAVASECPIDRIDAMQDQPRRHFKDGALKDLASSIREAGVLQPLLVAREGDRYRLIAGERRLRAARLAGLSSVPVVVRQATSKDAFVLALVENVQREDLGPVEQARAFERLIQDHAMTQEEVARRVGKDRTTVTNALRLLKCAPAVLRSLEAGEVSEGLARAVLPLDAAGQAAVVEQAVAGGWSVRQVEATVRQKRRGTSTRPAPSQPALADYFEAAREELELVLQAPVHVTFRANRGHVKVSFGSLAEFQKLREKLGGKKRT